MAVGLGSWITSRTDDTPPEFPMGSCQLFRDLPSNGFSSLPSKPVSEPFPTWRHCPQACAVGRFEQGKIKYAAALVQVEAYGSRSWHDWSFNLHAKLQSPHCKKAEAADASKGVTESRGTLFGIRIAVYWGRVPYFGSCL